MEGSMKLYIAADDREHAILVADEGNNDIAEFFHNEHATVGQSYETALMLARLLVSAAGAIGWYNDSTQSHVCNTGDGEVCPVCGRMGNGEGIRIEGWPQEA
jgi:hypothetical protein